MEVKEESKYYTPEIEEFHVGFEYETLEPIRDNSGRTSWNKWTIKNAPTRLAGIHNIYFEGKEEKIRVKHLDREDIESLGWEAVPMEGNLWQHYEKEGDSINGLYHEVNNIQNGVWFTWWNPNNSQTHATRLFIKNKSELKRILKMIGV